MIEVKLLTAPGCSSCKKAKETIKQVLNEFNQITIKEINIIDHPEVVSKFNIMSTPVIVINEKVVFHGAPKPDELKEKLKNELS